MMPRTGQTRRGLGGLAIALVLGTASGSLWAAAGEESIQLKDGPGRELTNSRCIICHSLDYIPSNAPALERATWQKELQKMKDRFGAPLTDEEAKQILDYLDGNYSGK